MYASQWFLTLFSAKFPLFLVFRVLDVFLLQGVDIIFQVINFLTLVLAIFLNFTTASVFYHDSGVLAYEASKNGKYLIGQD